MNDSPRLPYGYEDNVTCTEDKTGRVVIHWPEGCRGTVISRELLDAIVEEKNNCQRWIPVGERLPELGWDDMSTQVLVATADRRTWIGRYEKDEHGERWCIDTTQPAVAWMPLPEPPDVK